MFFEFELDDLDEGRKKPRMSPPELSVFRAPVVVVVVAILRGRLSRLPLGLLILRDFGRGVVVVVVFAASTPELMFLCALTRAMRVALVPDTVRSWRLQYAFKTLWVSSSPQS